MISCYFVDVVRLLYVQGSKFAKQYCITYCTPVLDLNVFFSNWSAASRCNIELFAMFADKMECGNLTLVHLKA